MSESDKLSLPSRRTAIVVETSSVKHKNYRQDPPDESYSEQHQRLSKAPAVPPVAEELKNIEEAAVLDDDEKKDLKTVKIDKLKHRDAASHSKPRGQSPQKFATEALNSTKHKVSLAQPIPTVADAKATPSVEQGADKDRLESTSTYSVLPDQQPEVAAVETQGVWSDDEEAGGLPRDAHGSRMARAFRKLLCLGSDDSDDFETKPCTVKHELDESPRTDDVGI